MFFYKRDEVSSSDKSILLQVVGCSYYGLKHKFKKFLRISTNENVTCAEAMMQTYSKSFVKDVLIVLKVSF